ncbi:MAG: type II secretion system F family protein [Saccharofermentans sp.]|nr:type II secretion system F family protein [Saccharofermentans sp.]
MKRNVQTLGSKNYVDITSIKTKFFIRFIWGYPLLALLIYFISSFYIISTGIRIVTSIILAFFPWKELVKQIFNNSSKNLRSQILVLLQVLTTSVSSGYSLDKSLSLVRPVIENTFGTKCPLIKPLKELENNLRVHIDPEQALDIFAHDIEFPETLPVFHALALSSKIGSNTLAILRSSCQMLSEMNAVQNEINASNAGKNAEAVMLCIMPFAITIALDQMGNGYLATAKSSHIGAILLGLAFVIAIISSALLFRFITHDNSVKNLKNEVLIINNTSKIHLRDFAQKFIPTGFITTQYELFNELSLNPRYAYEMYLRKQLLVLTSTFILGTTVLLLTNYNLILLLPLLVIIYFAGHQDIRKKVQLKKEELMKDLPLFLCLIYTLLEAGLQLPKAIEICSSAFKDNPSLSSEIKNMRAQMLSGTSASDAVEKMALRIQIPEAQAALLLVARYGRFGTSEVLNLLSLQSSACWDLCRTASRKKQERESLALLFPMTLDFICVLLVATTPAIISLGI